MFISRDETERTRTSIWV